MVVVNPDPEDMLIIPIDKQRFDYALTGETESRVTIQIVPRDPERASIIRAKEIADDPWPD